MNWRYILTGLALIALGILIFLNWQEIVDAIRIIKDISWYILLWLPVVQLASYYTNARYYQSFMETFGYKPKLRRLYELSLAVNFVNQVSPSAGITAASFLSYGLKGQVPAGKVTLIQYGRYALTTLSYAILLAIALALIYFGGGIDKIIVRVVVILVAGLLVLGGIFWYSFSNRRLFNKVVYRLQRLIDRTSRILRRRTDGPLIGKERVKRLLDEFHAGYDLVIKERHRLGEPFIYALLGNIMELLTIYVVFIALGHLVNPGAVMIGYAIANAVGVISIIPVDLGIYEVAMVTALSATGVSVAVGLSATIIYRVVNRVLFLPIGFYFYSKYLRGAPKQKRALLKS
ncbi:flippase-like domain-containing protein [Candidatus Microgenomates bacterium]|nr:flippase-like domain-containing protein [Candidatus Microgenomates bacterium]